VVYRIRCENLGVLSFVTCSSGQEESFSSFLHTNIIETDFHLVSFY
jgi:hypothetical protein